MRWREREKLFRFLRGLTQGVRQPSLFCLLYMLIKCWSECFNILSTQMRCTPFEREALQATNLHCGWCEHRAWSECLMVCSHLTALFLYYARAQIEGFSHKSLKFWFCIKRKFIFAHRHTLEHFGVRPCCNQNKSWDLWTCSPPSLCPNPLESYLGYKPPTLELRAS